MMIARKTRYFWLDIAKVLGMYLIVLGHFFPFYDTFIYTFSVPLFFVTSGLLGRKVEGRGEFFSKTFKRLILPTIILLPFHWVWQISHVVKDFSIGTLNEVFFSAVYGQGSALHALWFVYTLVIIKIIWQYFNSFMIIVINILCVIAAVVFHQREYYLFNSIVAVTTSLPFYSIGVVIKNSKIFDQLKSKVSISRLVLYITLSLIITGVCCIFNGSVWIHKACYGKDYLVFLIGGVMGTLMVFAISKVLELLLENVDKVKPYIELLSNGSLTILGLHWSFIYTFDFFGFPRNGLYELIWSLLIMLCMIPILIFCKKYLPVLAR